MKHFQWKRAAVVAAEHLRATGNAAVMVGDSHLLHEIADLLGMEHKGLATEYAVIKRIERTNQGELSKGYLKKSGGWGNVRARCFWLPECAPHWVKEGVENLATLKERSRKAASRRTAR